MELRYTKHEVGKQIIGRNIYIHASLSLSKSENVEKANRYLKSEIKPGYILCRCELVNCIPMTNDFIGYIYNETNESEYGKYAEGRFAWELRVIEVLNEPTSAKGKLGIWNYSNKL